ncbi:rab-GTPase-TBC domain-domain-containing protein [Leucosporidium creatinivorum]|uniref:Rab-GTPase-TBC domain-domain-containing protein n=1 Tax=Leucosporidium creatinivorum TaxID=106004 RepID=A0A1Y2FTV7_9BASI|nr:rab-GTPase-TBC domain-domain-containing protein [Leucosporidium creatinivorum]
MTALALASHDGSAVQLAQQEVQDSRLGVLAGAELSDSRARRRTISGDEQPNFDAVPLVPPPPSEAWRAPSRSSSVEPEAVTAAQASPGRRSPASASPRAVDTMQLPPRTSSSASNHSQHLTPLPRSSSSNSLSLPPSNGRSSPASATQKLPRSSSGGLAARSIPGITSSDDQRGSTASASSASGVTSNSSFQDHNYTAAPVPLAPPPSSVSPQQPFSADPSLDLTAGLIQKLYARLEEQGVPGDGWEEGRERSRDGIIHREEVEGGATVRAPKGAVVSETAQLKEDSVLKRVDRYGFFSQSHPAALACQHNRLATLSTAPYLTLPGSKRSSKSSAPPQPTPPPVDPKRMSTASLMPTLSPADIALETKRIDKWADMLTVARRDGGGNAKDWSVGEGWWDGRKSGGGGKYRKLQRRVFKGVPDRWRRAVWGLEMERVAREGGGGGRIPSLEELESEYTRLLEQPSSQDVQIDLDVPRTISGHVLFHTRYGQGQRALFHVLHAFGLHCDDIGGYCQGMGPIAATLLCYFEPERAYAGLVRLFDQYQLRHIFEPGFPGLVESFYVQERLVELLMPDVHKAFTEQYISTSAYATKWYITLFANSVPFATQLRFWDGLLLEGLDFLVITAVAIIWCFQKQFTAPDASFESILSVLSSYFFVESDDALLRWIRKTLRMKDLRNKITGWRKEWKGFVADGSASRKVT